MLSPYDSGVGFDGKPEPFSGRRDESVAYFPTILDGVLVDRFHLKNEGPDRFFLFYRGLVTRTIYELGLVVILNRQSWLLR